VLVADRGLCSMPISPSSFQAGVHAVLRVGARQIVDFTPGRPFVKPSVRRTPAVKGIPRSRWLKALGIHDQLVVWFETEDLSLVAHPRGVGGLADSLVLREVRYYIGTPGFRTRQITLVTTLLDAELYRVANLAELYRQRWQVETSLAHLKTTMTWRCCHCKTVSGCPEGTDRLCHRLQPSPHGHVALRHTPTHWRGADQFSGCAPLAERAEHRIPLGA